MLVAAGGVAFAATNNSKMKALYYVKNKNYIRGGI